MKRSCSPNPIPSEANMLDMIEITNTIESVVRDFPPVASEPLNERADEIASLWSAHLSAKNAARATKEELCNIRAKLGEQLSAVKKMLVSPGRDGQWSGFLREHRIPRATGDRLVARHEKTINPPANCVSEADSEPTEKEIEAFFHTILPRLQRTLRTPASVYSFVVTLASHYGCGEMVDRGILVLKPIPATICTASLNGNFDEPEMGASVVARTDS